MFSNSKITAFSTVTACHIQVRSKQGIEIVRVEKDISPMSSQLIYIIPHGEVYIKKKTRTNIFIIILTPVHNIYMCIVAQENKQNKYP